MANQIRFQRVPSTAAAQAYWRRLIDPDPSVHLAAAEAWNRYEGSCSVLMVDFKDANPPSGGASAQALALARIEARR